MDPLLKLYLNMLVVDGLDRVYNMSLQFRKVDIDLIYNLEFTTKSYKANHHRIMGIGMYFVNCFVPLFL